LIRATLEKRNQMLPPVASVDSLDRLGGTFTGAYIDAIVRFGRQLADALARTHHEGILHRDLKPSNVLVTPRGVPMLLDFNLSADTRAHASRVGGTLPYMAPEQVRQVFAPAGEGHAVDARSDVYSLGVILFELLAGGPPFDVPSEGRVTEATAAGLLDQQGRGCPRLIDRNRLVDAPLAEVIERCLKFDPKQRPQSAAELASLLEDALRPHRRARRWSAAYPGRAAGVAAAAACCVAIVALFFALRDPDHLRRYHEGASHFEQGRYEAARDAFQSAVDESPDFAAAVFGLALARQRIGDFSGAAAGYESLFNQTQDPKAAAGLAYCRGEEKNHWAAIHWYRTAIERGFDTPEIRNNLAASLRAQSPDHWAEALEHLNHALRTKPDLQAALYHRAVILANQSLADRKPPPQQAVDDLIRACRLKPAKARLLELAAEMHIRREGTIVGGPAAVEYLERAVDLGLGGDRIVQNKHFEALRELPRIKALLDRKGSATHSPVSTIDPLRDESPATGLGGI
jgi:tetratricopeptide (TPR) repeat protein